ncbi:MAG: AAA family ATPase [Lachnospiraceae bacterium]|nr:AAA family ATPase [Lachnospiraceae bacterium]
MRQQARRFGKSMAADMLTAYYSKGCCSDGLFAGFEIEKTADYQTHLNRHCVIRLDVQRFLETKRDLDTFIAEMERAVLEELPGNSPAVMVSPQIPG